MAPARRDDDGGIGTIDRTDNRHATKTRERTQRPSRYKVLLHNDDYTPFELVMHVLQQVFGMNEGQAAQVMMAAHKTGLCLCGVYPHEIAEQKAKEASDLGKKHDFALRFTTEKE